LGRLLAGGPIFSKVIFMACGGCEQRRQALIRAGKAVVKGEGKAALDEVKSVVVSVRDDAGSMLRQKTASARASLMRR
jgi:hypothetical protein